MRRAWLVLLGALCCAVPSWAAEFSADAVKATYLYRFSSYVTWPSAARDLEDFVIGVVGSEDVSAHLEQLLAGMSVGGKPARMRRVNRVEELQGVHILYISARVFRNSRSLREGTRDRPILVVTDARDGLAGGGVINFVEVNRRLRFEISLDAADRRGLKIDSTLLSVAVHVEPRRKTS